MCDLEKNATNTQQYRVSAVVGPAQEVVCQKNSSAVAYNQCDCGSSGINGRLGSDNAVYCSMWVLVD